MKLQQSFGQLVFSIIHQTARCTAKGLLDTSIDGEASQSEKDNEFVDSLSLDL